MKSNNNYYILDYKTGSVPKNPETDFQTIIYLLCAKEILQKGWGDKFSLSFVYINLKDNQNILIPYSDNKEEAFKNKVISVCDNISSISKFQRNPDACKYCEYNKFCN